MRGRLAQLARASRLHREGRGFESLSAHQKKTFRRGSLAQLVEQRLEEPCVPSSSLGGATSLDRVYGFRTFLKAKYFQPPHALTLSILQKPALRVFTKLVGRKTKSI